MKNEYSSFGENIKKKNINKNLNNYDFFVGNGVNVLEKEKDLDFKRKLFECDFKIKNAFANIMSSSISVKSNEENQEDKNKNLSSDKKKKKNEFILNKNFIFDNKKDLMDLGVNLLNPTPSKKQSNFSLKKTLTNLSNIGNNLPKNLTVNKDIQNKTSFKGKNKFLKAKEEENKFNKFYRDNISANSSIKLNFLKKNNSNNIFKNTFQTAFSLNSTKNIIIENIKTKNNKEFNPEEFRKINDLQNTINKNVFYKASTLEKRNLLSSRESRIKTALSTNLDRFIMREFDKNNYSSNRIMSDNFNIKNSNSNYDFVFVKKQKLSESSKLNHYENEQISNIYTEEINDSEEDNNNKLNSLNKKIDFNENDSDKEYDKEMLKNKEYFLKKRNTIKKIISKPESFDILLYSKENKKNENDNKKEKNSKTYYSINKMDSKKNKTNYQNNDKNTSIKYNKNKTEFKNSVKNSNKNETYICKNNNKEILIKDSLIVNPIEVLEFNKMEKYSVQENKIINKNKIKSNQSDGGQFNNFNIRNTHSQSSNRIKQNSNLNNPLFDIQENQKTKYERIFSGNEIKKIQALREKVLTPCSKQSQKTSINPHNFIRSINNIEQKTQKITKSFSNNFTKYKNIENVKGKNEDDENIYLKLPKKSNKIKKKVFMVSSSVEEQRKNFTHLSENKKNLLQIADFIESMNDKIIVNLKDDLERQYKKSAEKIGLIDLSEIMKNKLSSIFKRENKLYDLIIKSKQMKNSLLNTMGNIERKYLDKKQKIKTK